MQTLSEIRSMLAEAGLSPLRRFGQSFLVDGNLMAKLIELADVTGAQTVLEVGSGTGSLTEELLVRAGGVVAVEIDRGLCRLLRGRLGGRENITLIEGDVLDGKGSLSAAVLKALPDGACLVANLPYNIATPLIANCLAGSWRVVAGGAGGRRFDRLTFTVQQQVADRLAAGPGGGEYGPISVQVALLGRLTLGAGVPPTAFWPAPKVASRMVRIDFDAVAAERLKSIDALRSVLTLSFGQRRKQIGTIIRKGSSALSAERLVAALELAAVDPRSRGEAISPQQYLVIANAVS